MLPFLTSKVEVAHFGIGFQWKQLSTVYRIFRNKCMLEWAVEEKEGKQPCSEFIINTIINSGGKMLIFKSKLVIFALSDFH